MSCQGVKLDSISFAVLEWSYITATLLIIAGRCNSTSMSEEASNQLPKIKLFMLVP